MELIEDEAIASGTRLMSTDVRADNTAAIKLYECMGYKTTEQNKPKLFAAKLGNPNRMTKELL
ncbi:MAG: GNAT family N-acetyltransferase [bacterium]|nr:GNAT family N-acetyltransferase [bacterium]